MAKRSILDILINVVRKGDGDQAVVKGLAQVKSAIGQAGAVFGALVGTAYALNKAFDATGGEFVRYANEVRGLSQAFNLEAEDASRLIQVMDDLGITQDTLTKALKTMATNGIQPSLAGLQQLSTEYNAIQDPAKQAAFLVDNFGKAGLDMAAAMKLGADGLQAMNDATAEGLVLTNQSLQAARAYEIQVDQLNDTWTAFKVTIGQAVVPALTDSLLGIQANIIAAENLQKATDGAGYSQHQLAAESRKVFEQLKAEQQAQLDAEMGMTTLTEETDAAAQITRELDAANRALAAGLAGELSDALESSAEKSAELQATHAELLAHMQEIQEGGILESEVDDFNATRDAYWENVDAQNALSEATQETINKLLYQKVASHLTADAALDYARSLKLISEKDYALQKGIDLLTEKYDANKDGIVSAEEGASEYVKEIERLRNMILQLPAETVVDVIVNYISNGTPPPSSPTNPPPGETPTTPTGMSFGSATAITSSAGARTVTTASGDSLTFNAPVYVTVSGGASWGELIQTLMDVTE